MKHIVSLIVSICLMFLTFTVLGQADTTKTGLPTPDDLFSGFETLYGALVIIGGYLSYLIPGLNKISKNVYRVLAFAILIAIIFVLNGWMTGVQALFTYALSTSIYEVILKLFKKNQGEEIIGSNQ